MTRIVQVALRDFLAVVATKGFLFGLVTVSAGGNQRPGFLLLTAFFLIGLLLLQRVKDPKAPSAEGVTA